MVICRGIIYHKIIEELSNLLKSLFINLDDKKEIKKFENKFKKFNKSKYCMSYPFARSALMSILKTEANIKPGDEIIISSIQIKGMLDVIKNLRLNPIIVDISPETLNFDLNDLKKKINKKTKLILLTYLYGIVPDVYKILKIIKKKKIILVEDFSQCLGGKYNSKIVGNFGNYGIYSLSATKTLDTYGGGILVTNDKKSYLKNLSYNNSLSKTSRRFLIYKIFLSLIRNIFSKKPLFYIVILIFKLFNLIGYDGYSKFIGSRKTKLLNKIPKIWETKFTSLQAKYGSYLIRNVKKENKLRIKNVNLIKKIINKNYFPIDLKKSYNVYWQLALNTKNPNFVRKEALKNNIDIATPSIQLLSKVISNTKIKKSIEIYKNLLLLPSYHTLNNDEINEIGKKIKKYV